MGDRCFWGASVRAALSFVLSVLVLLGCGGSPTASEPRRPNAARTPPDVPLPGVALDKSHSVGPGKGFANLAIYPVYAKSPLDLGEFTTLEKAIAQNEAEVREVGGGTLSGGEELQTSQGSRDAQVSKLVIQNKGKLPILVLAGTIVKGGKQDRQIGEDFVVPRDKQVDVSAFCVEQGRWNGTRDGVATGGKFSAQKALAIGKVRAAGQYENDQSQVWSKVDEVNHANGKKADSGTLLATMSDPEIGEGMSNLSAKANAALAEVEQQDRLVGVAYAVNGEIRGIRWFAGPALFALHRETLLQTAALEAITAEAETRGGAKPAHVAVPEASEVTAFIDRMEVAAVQEAKSSGSQTQEVRKADEGYASELRYDFSDSAAPAKRGKPTGKKAKPSVLTKDFFKK